MAQTQPSTTPHFVAQLTHAIARGNVADVAALVQQTAAQAARDPALRPWQRYAEAYLANERDHTPRTAIALLEPLRYDATLELDLRERVLNELGLAYELAEQWDRAQQCYHECIAINEARGDELGLGIVLYNLSLLHYKAAEHDVAAASARRSIALLAQRPDDEQWQRNLGMASNNLALALTELRQLDEARAAGEQALQLAQALGSDEEAARAANNLGHIHRLLGNLALAEEHHTRAYALFQQLANHFDAADVLHGLAKLKLGQPASVAQAHALLDEALALAQQTNHHAVVTDVLLDRAALHEQQGNATQALHDLRAAVASVEGLRANIALPEGRVRLQGARIRAYEQLVGWYLRHGDAAAIAEVFRVIEMAKSRALVEMLVGRELRGPARVPSALVRQEAIVRGELQQRYADATPDAYTISRLELELAGLHQQIQQLDPEFQSLHSVQPLALDAVQSALLPGECLLEYFTVDETIVALAITPDDATLVHVPLTVAQLARVFGGLEQRQHQLRHLLPRDGRLHAPWVLAKLYDTLLAPLGSAVAAAQHLWIVPHGLLHYVPFHALYRHEGDEQHWLLDAQNGVQSLSYAPSATTLFDYCRRKPPSTRSGCLALGYNDPSLMLPLAHAEREAQRVAELLGGDSRVGADATRAALLDEAQRYRYVHLSCHGWFDPAWPLASGLRLADGVLNVADMLYALRLEADLVCLSACETGQSHQLRGDELIGFTRACLYAGTPAVLASHWVVDEVATSVLMQRFYQELLALRDQPNRNARALARAQRYLRTLPTAELRAQLSQHGLDAGAAARYLESLTERLGDAPPNACLLAHPYYWAAFFLTGI